MITIEYCEKCMPGVKDLSHDSAGIFKYLIDYYLLYKTPCVISNKEIDRKVKTVIHDLEKRKLIISTECEIDVIAYKPYGLKKIEDEKWIWCGGECKAKR